MAQQFLHAAQVPAPGKQMGGEGMAQGVGRGFFRQAQRAPQALHQALGLAGAHRFAPAGKKQRRSRRAGERDCRIVIRNRIAQQRQHRHAALLAALSQDRERLAQRHVAPFQRQRLGDAQARAIQQRQQGGVAAADPVDAIVPRHHQRPGRILLRQRPGQPPGQAWGTYAPGRRVLQDAFAGKEAIEATDRRQHALHALRSQPFGAAICDEGADIGGRQFRQRRLAHRSAQMVRQETAEAGGVVAIGAQRVRRGAAFMRQLVQPELAQIVEASALCHQL